MSLAWIVALALVGSLTGQLQRAAPAACVSPQRRPPTLMGPPPPVVSSAQALWNLVPIMVVGRVTEMSPPRVEHDYVFRDAPIQVVEVVKRGTLPAQIRELKVRFFGGEATIDCQRYSTDGAGVPSVGDELLLFLNGPWERAGWESAGPDVYRLSSYRFVPLRPRADGGIDLWFTSHLNEVAGKPIVTREDLLAVFSSLNAP